MPDVRVYLPEEMDKWICSKITKRKTKVDVVFEILLHVKHMEDEARTVEYNKHVVDEAGL